MNIFGELKVIKLIPGGSETEVTNSNKKDFVKRMAYAKMADEIFEQSEALILGIHEMIPENEISILTEKDLGMRLAGSPKINSISNLLNFIKNHYYNS